MLMLTEDGASVDAAEAEVAETTDIVEADASETSDDTSEEPAA